MPSFGAADRIPERITQLVYLDAVVLDAGMDAFSIRPAAEAEAGITAAELVPDGLAVSVPGPSLPDVWAR